MVASKEELASKTNDQLVSRAQELKQRFQAGLSPADDSSQAIQSIDQSSQSIDQPSADAPKAVGAAKDQLLAKAQELSAKARKANPDADLAADSVDGGLDGSGLSKDQLVSRAQEFAEKVRARRPGSDAAGVDADVAVPSVESAGVDLAASKEQLAEKAQELTGKVRDSRFGKEVLGPKVAQPLASWLDTNFGDDTAVRAGGLSTATAADGAATQETIDRIERDAAQRAADANAEVATLRAPSVEDEDVDLALSSPKDLPGFFKALGARVKDHNLVVVAAGIAFWGLLAIPAILIATVSIAGLVLDPATVKDSVKENLTGLPEEAQEIIGGQLEAVSGGSSGGLILGVLLGIFMALWTASGAMAKLMGTLNLIYNTTETRKFVKLRGTAIGLTFGGIFFISSAVFLLAAMPALLGSIDGVGDSLVTLFNILRFPILGIVMVLGLGVLYHVGPDRTAKYRPLTVGAAVAMVLWISLSGLFTVYTSTVGSYNETYGTMGGLVILLMWLFITAFVVLLGAEIHSESEASEQA